MPMRVIDGRAIAAARALANVGAKELAKDAGVTERTVGRLEVDAAILISPRRRHGHVARDTFDKIVTALRQRGVELVDEVEGHGAGVRWVHPRAKRG